jgi:hypothetical protein
MPDKQLEDSKSKQVDGRTQKITWDVSNASSTYANVCTVSFTREEVVLLFGINQAWQGGDQKELTIQVTDRIILSPFAAKRLGIILNNVLKEYENRFGALEAIPQGQSQSTNG